MSAQDPGTPAAPVQAAVERMTTDEVLALARISRATLWRRIAHEQLPRPIDCAQQSLFSRAAILAALANPPLQRSRAEATETRLERLRQRRQKKRT